MTQFQVPAHFANRGSRGLSQAATAGLAGGQPPHISLEANRFSLVDAGGSVLPINQMHLDVVLIDANEKVSKVYYDTPFQAGSDNYGPPACFADNGVAPSSQASKPQSETCALCPHNAWGSDVSRFTGNQRKACNDYKKLAVIVVGDQSNMAYMLRIPPATLKNLKAYCGQLAQHSLGDRPVEPSDVVTRLEFESQGVLKLSPVTLIDAATAARIDELDNQERASKVLSAIVGRLDVPRQGALPAPQQTGAQPAPAPATMMPPPAPAPAQQPAPFAPQPVVETQTQKPRGRPRTKAEPAPQPQPQPQPEPARAPFATPQDQQAQGSMFGSQAPQDGLTVPSFLRRDYEQARPQGNGGAAGVFAPSQQPTDDVTAALARALNLPT